MFLKLLFVIFVFTVISFSISTQSALALSPDEYCKIHEDSKAPGVCTVCGGCAVLISNLGTHECKKCTDGGCEMADCAECSEYPGCVKETTEEVTEEGTLEEE